MARPHPTPPLDSAAPSELVRAAGLGDAEAIRALYELHVDAVYAFVFYRVGRDASVCEDVVQETFLAALDRHADYAPERGSVRAWLCTRNRSPPPRPTM